MYSLSGSDLGRQPRKLFKGLPQSEPLPRKPASLPQEASSRKEVPGMAACVKKYTHRQVERGHRGKILPRHTQHKESSLNDSRQLLFKIFMPCAVVRICDHCGTAGKTFPLPCMPSWIQMLQPGRYGLRIQKGHVSRRLEHISTQNGFQVLLIQGLLSDGTGSGAFQKHGITEPLFCCRETSECRDHTRRPQEHPL